MTCTADVPWTVRAGTRAMCPSHRTNSLRRANIGVQGALIASLFDPLPFRLPRLAAHFRSRSRDARCCSLSRKGKGCAPAPHLAAARPVAIAPGRWPQSINSSPTAIQGGVVDDVLDASSKRFYFRSPTRHDSEVIESSDPVCLSAARESIACQAVFTESGLRHRDGRHCRRVRHWIPVFVMGTCSLPLLCSTGLGKSEPSGK